MSRWTAYRQVGLVGALGALGALVLAACTPVGPGVDGTATPTPATPAVPAATPSIASPAPTPTPAAATSTPLVIDYDYDYGDVPVASPPPAESGSALIDVADDAAGDAYLVGPDGMALYTFRQDDPGVSNCLGTCAQTWPPLTVESEAELSAASGLGGTLGAFERDDGTLQVTYNDAPLYYYVADQAPTDTTGHEVGGVWFLARP